MLQILGHASKVARVWKRPSSFNEGGVRLKRLVFCYSVNSLWLFLVISKIRGQKKKKKKKTLFFELLGKDDIIFLVCSFCWET
ncbi:hypothetical protein QUC31_014686 [Theobroma cacao]